MARSDIALLDSVDSVDSYRLIGRIVRRANRPAPEWRRTSSFGTAEPVRMYWPGAARLSTCERTWFQTLVPSSCLLGSIERLESGAGAEHELAG